MVNFILYTFVGFFSLVLLASISLILMAAIDEFFEYVIGIPLLIGISYLLGWMILG